MKQLPMNGRAAASAAGLLVLISLLTGCQSGAPADKTDPAARAKFLGSGPSPEEKAKMAELQAKAMQSGPGTSGPSAAQAEAIKRARQGK